MVKTNVLTKSITITFSNDAGEYSGYSFQYVQNEALAWVIIDWLNGGYSDPTIIGSFSTNDEAYDIDMLDRKLTTTMKEYVTEKLVQKLNIHLNEFNYKFENTEDIGIPYLEKPTKDELDLFIKEAIQTTIGVKQIESFASRMVAENAGKFGKNRISYFVEFKIKIETGESIWQSIGI